MIGLASSKDTAKVKCNAEDESDKSTVSRAILELCGARILINMILQKHLYELHAIKVTTRDGRPPLDGDVITSARTSIRGYRF